MELQDEVIYVNRVAKVVKGGRRFNLSALVAVGDGQGHVGIGMGKGSEVPVAVQKAVRRAKKSLIKIPLVGDTIPHEVIGSSDAARVFMKPAAPGTGVIAGGVPRVILRLAGVKNVLTKSLGADNAVNIAKATIEGLKSLRSAEEVAALRGQEKTGSKEA
ncbi:MAG: 30S ribosomal protein S5 [Candidatus Subteraquimicrobiales bacterium]|nr:30S ribosomal protein S5 [Candidatus Subteraquimicrobiales bacterium]